MKQIKVIIVKSKIGYSANGEKIEGIKGQGDTVQKAKEAAVKSLDIILKQKNKQKIPAELKGNYRLIFKFDIQSFLSYYKGILTNAGLERITGIHQKQIQHYATGLYNPKETTIRKIQMAVHQLANELLAVEIETLHT